MTAALIVAAFCLPILFLYVYVWVELLRDRKADREMIDKSRRTSKLKATREGATSATVKSTAHGQGCPSASNVHSNERRT